MSCSSRRMLSIVLVALLSMLAAPLAPAQDKQAWTVVNEYWYSVELAGSPAGWMHVEEATLGELLRTTSTTKLLIGRGATATSALISSAFIETADSKPVRMEYSQDMSTQVVQTTWTFEDESIVQQSRQGGAVSEKRQPLVEGAWLTPRQVETQFRHALAHGDEALEYNTLDGASGIDPVAVHQKRVGNEEIELAGKTVPVTVWETKTSAMPVVAVERYDAEGVLVSQEIDLGIGKMISRRTTHDLAMQSGKGDGPELLVATFVKPDKPLSRVNQITRLELRLHMKDDSELPELPTAGAQRVTRAEDGKSALLVIMPSADESADVPADAAHGDEAQFTEPSAMIGSDDAKVMELAEKAVHGEAADSFARAEAMRAFVRRYISQKGLEVAFASAAETAQSRKGDCSEHAVLLCAMLRAQNIPARVATGLVYADSFAGQRDFFGWHMWTQAWIDGKWIDFDATLARRFHAGHIMIGASSLAGGVNDADFASLILVMGRLEVDVVNVEYAGHAEPSSAR